MKVLSVVLSVLWVSFNFLYSQSSAGNDPQYISFVPSSQNSKNISLEEKRLDEVLRSVYDSMQVHARLITMKIKDLPRHTLITKGKTKGNDCIEDQNQEDISNDCLKVEIFDFVGDADLAGYNSDRFDVPMLMEEFHRIGIHFDISKRRLIDIQKIFYKMEPRTLKAAYRLYCDGDLSDAHDALADTKATVEVFKGQILRYADVNYIDGDGFSHPPPIKNDIDAIASFIKDDSALDVTQRLKLNTKGQVVFNFGKFNLNYINIYFQFYT
jgi:hypothetical protein